MRTPMGNLIIASVLITSEAQGGEKIPLNPREFGIPAEVISFAKKVDARLGRYLLRTKDEREGPIQVDPDKLEDAVANSSAWIKAILKDDFVPADLESRIEGLPAALDGVDVEGTSGSARFDCTIVSLVTKDYRFIVVQDGFASVVFVTLPRVIDGSPVKNPEKWDRVFREHVERFFQHATASIYLRAIRLTDYGLELAAPFTAWYADENRWRSTVLAPPKVCVDALLNPMEHPTFSGSPKLGRKMREIDPTIPATITDSDVARHWWAAVYAATDGHVLVYSAAKTGAGQVISVTVPDWFRIAEPGEIPGSGKKGGHSRPEGTFWPPR